MRQTSTGAKEKPTTTRTGPAAAWLAALSRLRRRIATAAPSMDGPNSSNGVGQSTRSHADANRDTFLRLLVAQIRHQDPLSQDFRFGSSDGTSLHPHPAKRNHFSTRKRRRLRRDRSSPLLAPHGG